jgi:thioredoxin reductase
VFFTSALPQKSPLAQSLGCQLDEGGSVICQQHAATGVPGLYVAGNVRGGVHLAIMAAAEGAEAGIAINEELADRELKRPPGGGPARETDLEERPGAQIPTRRQSPRP